MPAHRPFHRGCRSPDECEIDRRALALWPRLDRRALSRCRHDRACVVTLVERRTRLPPTAIWNLLAARPTTREEAETWFG